MPNLAGKSLGEVVREVDLAGFAIGTLKYAQATGKTENTILSQYPRPGWQVTDRRSIDIVVNRHAGSSDDSAEQRPMGSRLFSYRVPDGFLKRKLRLRMNAYGFSGDVIDRHFKPGEELWFLLPKDTNASLFLFEDGLLIRTAVFGK